MAHDQLTALVVGAGIGSLAAAISFGYADHKVTALEKHKNKREVGFAVTLSPNATTVLQSLGLDFKKWPTKATWRAPLDHLERGYDSPWMTVHRADLHNCLRDMAAAEEGDGLPVEIVDEVSVVDYDSMGSVTLHTGEKLAADIIVAADGVKYQAHKAIISDDKECPAKLSDISNKVQTTKQVARHRIQAFHPNLRGLLDYCADDDLYLWKVADRDPLPKYHKHRLIVLGDAAHPMLPTLGNGVGMAIEDAGALGAILENLKNANEVPNKLSVWERVRRPQASAVQLLIRTTDLEYKLSSETQDMVREYLSEEQLPEFTRACVNNEFYNCIGDLKEVAQTG